jgi:hypothetical protein
VRLPLDYSFQLAQLSRRVSDTGTVLHSARCGVDREERRTETADAWHLALLQKGFSEIPL